jgi:hypothetical protein
MFSVRYGLNLYILMRINSVFKGLIKHPATKTYGRLEVQLHAFLTSALNGCEW